MTYKVGVAYIVSISFTTFTSRHETSDDNSFNFYSNPPSLRHFQSYSLTLESTDIHQKDKL